MIKEFTVSNFFSIKDSVKISFETSKNKRDKNDNSSFISPCGNCLNSVVSLVGSNGAGKSNILNALVLFLLFIQESYQKPHKLPIYPYITNIKEKKTTDFYIIFENGKKEYEYQLKINYRNSEIIYEKLGVHKERAYSCIYEIEKVGDIFNFKNWNFDEKLNDFDKVRFKERKNSTMFSFLLTTGHLNTIGIKNLVKIATNIIMPRNFSDEKIAAELSHDEGKLKKIQDIVKNFEVGIELFNIKDETISNPNNPFESQKTVKKLFFTHKNEKESFDLPFILESDGTQIMIFLLNEFFPILEQGGIVICDEIEHGIHPFLINNIIELFANNDINKNNAQLIFSTHAHLLLKKRKKSQIYLVEKKDKLSTSAYRLDDRKGVRNDEKFYEKYLEGAYDAVPPEAFKF